MRIALGEPDEERGDILGEPMVVGRIVGEQYLVYPGDGRSRLSDRAAILARHQDIDIVPGDFLGGGDGVERRGL